MHLYMYLDIIFREISSREISVPLARNLAIIWIMRSGGKTSYHLVNRDPGPLFTKWTDVLRQDLVKPRSREIQVQTFPVSLKFDRRFGSSVTEMPVKFQNGTIIAASNLAASRLHEIWR